jgi:hypothetical protein
LAGKGLSALSRFYSGKERVVQKTLDVNGVKLFFCVVAAAG